MKRNTKPQPHQSSRSGFSLIELLVVIVIIGILMALILPAINRVRYTAQVKQVAAELSQLDTAMTTFSSDFGVEPYSELVVTEDPAAASSAWDSTAALTQSRTRLRRIWPQMSFTTKIDFNADGAFTGDSGSDATLTLTASECLVFFLGGVMNRDKDNSGIVDPGEVSLTPSWIGFSKNPVNPFVTTGANRIGPLFTLDNGRLVDTDGDGMMEYKDSLPGQTSPLFFVSSNNGQGYSPLISYYVQPDGKTPWNKASHQLISPGLDGQLGFNPTAGLKGPYGDGVKLDGTRAAEADNIANFKAGSTLGD